MIRASLAALGVALASGRVTAAKDACVPYGPERVTLVGKAVPAIGYGAPDYGGSPDRDAKERFLSLTLDRALCVAAADRDSPEAEAESNVHEVQLLFGRGAPEGLAGRRLRVTGTLFHGITGHHHTKVLMTVNRVDLVGARMIRGDP
jgi:hypothetical protein